MTRHDVNSEQSYFSNKNRLFNEMYSRTSCFNFSNISKCQFKPITKRTKFKNILYVYTIISFIIFNS
ncbi:hypothetical protein GLOIN_2v427201 [Rhizophagus irregularis DAOM 181602=DAOM 197198]|uniref:Uncharacterized protein n=1 Tax=Rhizophagus irregularis (strain DAOM 181602 / DAOM 197198 / MUCL 43194) TaxID=747089 RepID=A0A2P4PJ25_RHIID|nr:hypothetical protein GLOIN_2v427201 [Rhizophagus irregularis DAOM 181602=DAOM 197198]POG65368.1 hypothetical protein GLOIN_2v427201 [Rhizophagus irregularis DAOM 181602=DAOM 197198]GET58073.1 hypothetical protein GLOIN_2v427201 [Rhizophagus irregularis DAOM 181602=DAOM 197198]|eukprot:XP_025172234.1 hypothetical protein GLOIN_2v427201 [Rhizophagus irregularis DAOM 181602=DAOM 197198]